MTLFFFVVGLEARREFDLGELRERRRLALPLLAGLGGMAVPVAIYLAVNAGQPAAHGWGVAMSTDTAFALGLLALVGRHAAGRACARSCSPSRVVDDLVALVVIAVVYSDHVDVPCRCWSRVASFAVVLVAPARRGAPRARCTRCSASPRGWRCSKSGVDPVVVGLAMGLLTLRLPGRAATTWSAPPACSGCSASSRRPSWHATARARHRRRDLARTSGSSACTTRGRAT